MGRMKRERGADLRSSLSWYRFRHYATLAACLGLRPIGGSINEARDEGR